MISIIENTLRDGSYAVDFQISKEQTAEVTQGLSQCGFEMIEVGHGLGLGAYKNENAGLSKENDESYISAAKEAAGGAKVSAFFIPGIGNKEDIKKAHALGLNIIRIGANVDEYERCHEYVDYAKSLGMVAAVNLMKSYAVKSYEFSTIAEDIDTWGLADVIYLVDSAGCMTPEEVNDYLYRTSERSGTALGFHGHNNLSLAAANTMQAVKSGATYIDTCIRGMGRSAGNAQTEIVIILLQKLGFYEEINIYDLYELANNIVAPMMNHSQGMTDDEIHIGYSKFHSGYASLVESSVKQYQVDAKRVIKGASEVNCLNPAQELFDQIAKEIRQNASN